MKKEKAITLISLVITIIILIILAGVGINLSLGENGIFRRAKEARDKYGAAAEKEQQELNELYAALNGNDLPENTKDTLAGTPVKLPSNWATISPQYVRTTDGKVVKETQVSSNVTAIATGNGETVPVPKGFYYVGGTISTGVVISDNSADQNKYVNYTPTGEVAEGIPAGVAYNEDGTVNVDNSELKGNQFVWIPCSKSEYVKKDWGKENATWERQTHSSELPQIKKYGGFYVGRYEAGTSNIKLSTNVNFSAQNTASNWANDNFSIRDGLNHSVTEGIITTKAGEVPYYHADYETALKLSNSMYDTENVQSGLVTGTMWDAMMKFIAGSDNTVVTSSTWGNYTNGSVTYKVGKGRYASVDSGNGAMISAFTKSNGSYNYGIKTTAISEDVKKKNLYDVAGNLWEWTQEASYVNTTETYMLRGGSFYDSYAAYPACYRGGSAATYTATSHGFRPALYIK